MTSDAPGSPPTEAPVGGPLWPGGPVDPEAYQQRFARYSFSGAAAWLVFLLPVAQEGWRRRTGVEGLMGLVLLLAFCLVYLAIFGWRQFHDVGSWDRRAVAKLGAMVLLAILAAGVVACLGPVGVATFVFVAVSTVMLLPIRVAVSVCLVLALVSEGLGRLPDWSSAEGTSLSIALSCLAAFFVRRLVTINRQLMQARVDNAQLAVAAERNRMARDLHDILGHSLTVITVKSQLAGRLVHDRPDAAKREVEDIERLSRVALRDVRSTIQGVQEVTLPGELVRARNALAAAEIEAEIPGAVDDVPEQLRQVFAWAVREGVTNVIRHSAATRCTIEVTADAVSVVDDGLGASHSFATGGRGLAGLRERARQARCALVTRNLEPHGFSLAVIARRTP